MTATTLLLATRSAGKLRELRPLLTAAGYQVLGLDDAGIAISPDEDAIEVHDEFSDNAIAKAIYFYRLSGGVPTVADDSGLVVEALGGAPGVHSRRWSAHTQPDLTGQALDDANNARLMAELRGVEDRSARYLCAASYLDETRRIVRLGETAGRVLEFPQGSGGFGYDPYFHADDLGSSFASASIEAKEKVSHRGRAWRALVEALRSSG